MPITNQQKRVLRQMFAKEREGVERGLAREAEPVAETFFKAVVAQNFVRMALEIAVEESIPFDRRFIAELAVRVCSYVISVAPIEEHDPLLKIVCQNLASAHRERVKQGIVIRTEWETDGYMRPNVPTGSEIN